MAILYFALGTGLGAYMLGRQSRHRALNAAEHLRFAIASGKQRDIEFQLRRTLALVSAGEAVNYDREWLARAQLGGLLVAEWRLDEAREVYDAQRNDLPDHLQALANFGRHELSVLTSTPTAEMLETIRRDRDQCIALAPKRYQKLMSQTWDALEGLCLVRMGRAREAISLMAEGMDALAYSPARVVYLYHLAQAYEHIGEHQLAGDHYRAAAEAFPGTRLANEAQTRVMALGQGSGAGEGLFRHMLPEAPSPQTLYPEPQRALPKGEPEASKAMLNKPDEPDGDEPDGDEPDPPSKTPKSDH